MTRIGGGIAAVAVSFATLSAFAPAAFAVTKLSDAEAASQLSDAGITRSSSGGCTDRGTSTCTSYSQINQSTVSGVITLKRASGCGINITGGTEVGHSDGTYSHYNGYKVDIALNSCINSYIRNSFTEINPPTFGSEQYRSSAGNTYTNEGNHWDIEYH